MTPIRTAAEYEQALTIVNAILDMIGDDEDHPLAEALDLIANQVEAWEAVHVKLDAELYHLRARRRLARERRDLPLDGVWAGQFDHRRRRPAGVDRSRRPRSPRVSPY